MIKNIKDYKEYRKADLAANPIGCSAIDRLLLEHSVYIEKYIKLLRLDELLTNGGALLLPAKILIRCKRNRLGAKLGFTISPNCFGKGLLIWHYGNIVVNGEARIGDNCILHGDNCIGNDGKSGRAPKIGNNVDIGVGAKIIGDIEIADNVIIGAGAIVVKSCTERGATLVGVPAKVLR